VVDREDTHPAVNEPFVKLLYAWLVDWPKAIVVDWKAMVETINVGPIKVLPVSVETVIVEPVRVEKAARFILMDDPTVIDEALTVGKE